MVNLADLHDSGFTPQLVVPSSDYFQKDSTRIPLEKAPGVSWYDLKDNPEYYSLPVTTHLKIGLIAATQLNELAQSKGLTFMDRCSVNIFASGFEEDDSLVVTQIDLEEVIELNTQRKRKGIRKGEFIFVSYPHSLEMNAFDIARDIRDVLKNKPHDLSKNKVAIFMEKWSDVNHQFKNIGYVAGQGLPELIGDLNELLLEASLNGM